MEQLNEKMKTVTDAFLKNVKEVFGNKLISVILYGPAARGEQSKTPYINFMVVVNDNTPSELARCSSFVKSWYKQLITIPLFLTPDYIEQSLDTFPLEFMDMSSSYHVVFGKDVLEGISFDITDVRNQCERELKGKLLHLRAEYLNLRSDRKGIIDLINRSLNTFRLVFSGALYLKKLDIPSETGKMVEMITSEYGFDASLFKKLSSIVRGDIKIDENEADRLFDSYIEELDKLSEAIDNMTFTEET